MDTLATRGSHFRHAAGSGSGSLALTTASATPHMSESGRDSHNRLTPRHGPFCGWSKGHGPVMPKRRWTPMNVAITTMRTARWTIHFRRMHTSTVTAMNR